MGGPKWGVRFFSVTSKWRADDATSIDFDTTNKVVWGKACVSSVWRACAHALATQMSRTPFRSPPLSGEFPQETLRAQRLKKFKIALRDWNFQSRLKFSIPPPTKPLFLWGILKVRDWKFQARLKISIEIEIFNRDWFFFNLWALRDR